MNPAAFDSLNLGKKENAAIAGNIRGSSPKCSFNPGQTADKSVAYLTPFTPDGMLSFAPGENAILSDC
jgi:hypothetical protein